MLCDRQGARCITLPGWGALLVSTDLHGNYEDFRVLRDRYRARRRAERDVCWLILGDAIHGPDEEARRRDPALYDFEDRSREIIAEICAMVAAEPDHVFFLLGNHEHAHVGGARTRKFHTDEAAHLEAQLDAAAVERLRSFCRAAPLIAVAPCGLVFCHGSPGAELESLEQLLGLDYDEAKLDDEQRQLLRSLLNSYGQGSAVTAKVLDGLRRSTGFELSLMIHGHDRDEAGWFAEGGNQLCPVIFGAPRDKKRYLELDLGARYRSLESIREGLELRLLHHQ